MRTAIPGFLALLLTAGCTGGTLTGGGPDVEGDDDDNDPIGAPDAAPEPDAEPPATYAMTIEPSLAELSLNESVDVEVTLTSDRFAGVVVLSAEGYPESWEVTFSPSSSPVLDADGTTAVTMTVRVPSDGEAGDIPMTVSASAAPGQQTADLGVNVANELVLPITPGTGNGQHAFPPSITVRLGTTVTFSNFDDITHRIHSSVDADGFPHEPSPGMAQNGTFSVSPTVPGGYDYYCHEHDAGSGTGILQVVDPAAE